MLKTSWRIYKKNKSIVNSMCSGLSIFALAFATSANAELPTGGQYVAGSGSIASSGNIMDINQSTNRGIINWGGFNIGQGNVVNINNGTGATLNRVISNSPSSIYGQLNATGSAYLINQNGVVVGNTGVINTGGNFVASTLDTSDKNFVDGGDIKLQANGKNADIVNLGKISAGGDAVLIGRNVLNQGDLKAGKTAALAAGDEVLLTDSNSAIDRVYVNLGQGSVTNSGVINGANAELKASSGNIYSMAIKNDGVVRASGLQNQGGRLILGSNQGLVENTGTLDASSETGIGGDVKIEAQNINLAPKSMIDASGALGGGKVLIGGGAQGRDTTIKNAKINNIDKDATINVSATKAGNGGSAVVWSDNKTSFKGTIDARGAGITSKGGDVEVSSKNELVFASWNVDTRGGEQGQDGTLLIDPTNIRIIDGSATGTVDPTSNTLTDADIQNHLQTRGSLVVTTAIGGSQEGDITVDNNVNVAWSRNNTLLLRADRDVNLAGTFDASAATGTANIRVDAARDINVASNTILKSGKSGEVTLNAAVRQIPVSGSSPDYVSQWKDTRGAVAFGDNVQITANNVNLRSGKTSADARTNLGSSVKLNPANTSGYAGIQALGFNNINLNSNNNSDIVTNNGSVILVGKNITIDESIKTKGDLYLSAAAFDNSTNNFVPVNSDNVTNARDDYRSDGWKTNKGTVNFSGNNLLLDICCGITITSGLSDDNTRTNLTSPTVTFAYNNSYNIYQWFEVKGFENFNTTIEGNSLKSNSFVDIRNSNNTINYDAMAGVNIPTSTEIPAGETSDAFSYLRIMGGVHNSSNVYSDNIFNAGTTTFDNTLKGSALIVSADKDLIITSGVNDGTRTSITDGTDTTPEGVSYAGRTDNVKLQYKTGESNFEGNVRVEGFRDIALDTSDISGNLVATGNITTYSSNLTNINDNLTAANMRLISEKDIYLRNASTLTASGNATLVVDEQSPFKASDGKLVTQANTNVNASTIALFTSRQPLNILNGKLNTNNFFAGLQYQDTGSEIWNSFFQANNRSAKNPFVVYYKDSGNPQIVFSRPDCSVNPSASGCSNFVEGPDDAREYRINLTEYNSNVGEETLAEGNSTQIRKAEFFTATSAPIYLDNRLTTEERIRTAAAFPLQIVGATLSGFNTVPGFAGIAMALNTVTEGISDVVVGTNSNTPR